MSLPRMEFAAAAGVTGFAVIQLFDMYQKTAPKLVDVRLAPEGDLATNQALMDADILVGGLAILVGATAGILSRQYLPPLLMLAGFLLVSMYYHAVCHSPNTSEVASA